MKTWIEQQTWSQRIGYALGLTYVLVGLAGFVVTSGVGFFATTGKDLVVFEVNPLHNVIHLLVGAALVGAARASAASSRLMNALVGGVYLVVAVAGAIVVQMDVFPGLDAGRSELNILALNHPDNLLHVFSSSVLLVVSLFMSRPKDEIRVEPIPVVVKAKPKAKSKPKAKAAVRGSSNGAPRSSAASRGSRR